jgi:hypothetical protein
MGGKDEIKIGGNTFSIQCFESFDRKEINSIA